MSEGYIPEELVSSIRSFLLASNAYQMRNLNRYFRNEYERELAPEELLRLPIGEALFPERNARIRLITQDPLYVRNLIERHGFEPILENYEGVFSAMLRHGYRRRNAEKFRANLRVLRVILSFDGGMDFLAKVIDGFGCIHQGMFVDRILFGENPNEMMLLLRSTTLHWLRNGGINDMLRCQNDDEILDIIEMYGIYPSDADI